jgi:hypothetical protein
MAKRVVECFTREGWVAMQVALMDVPNLNLFPFEENERRMLAEIESARSDGIRVEIVDVCVEDIDRFVAWCRVQKRPLERLTLSLFLRSHGRVRGIPAVTR